MYSAGLRTFTLVFLITGAIDSIRNLPSMALFGNSLIFFFVLSSLLFLIPVALISATLSSCWPQKGGIYSWVKEAFGEKIAFLAIWLQWINTLIWLPTILSFIAGTSAYLINPHFASNKYYLLSIIFLLNGLLTWVNLKGIKVSAKISTVCAIIGTIFPISLILILGSAWLLLNHPLQLHMNIHDVIPNFSHINNWISLTAIITSFLGVELTTVHIKDVYNPQRTFPKALAISVFLVIVTLFFGALSIALVLPKQNIGLVDGIAETFSFFLQEFHLSFLLPLIVIMMLIGSFGGIISWIISPTRGLLQAVEYGYLPSFFAKVNTHDAPANLLMTQTALTCLLSLGFLIVPSVNSVYWFLTDLSTQLYILMYVFMFISALALVFKVQNIKNAFKIPGGKFGYLFVCLLGLTGCVTTLVIGFIPPENTNLGTNIPYQIIFAFAMLIMISPVFIFYLYSYLYRSKYFKNLSILATH